MSVGGSSAAPLTEFLHGARYSLAVWTSALAIGLGVLVGGSVCLLFGTIIGAVIAGCAVGAVLVLAFHGGLGSG